MGVVGMEDLEYEERKKEEERERWDKEKANAHELYEILRKEGWKDWQEVNDMSSNERYEFLRNNLVIVVSQGRNRDKYYVVAKGQTYDKQEIFKQKKMEWDPYEREWAKGFEWALMWSRIATDFARELAEKTGATLYFYDWR